MLKTDLIKGPKVGDDKVTYPDGTTKDIIKTVLYADKKAAWYTDQFAPQLKGKTLWETCRNVWAFVKNQIPYVLDASGKQWIKSPGRLWIEKAGDCKSFSVFTASCLRNLGIPYGYRFASYRSDPTPTHVYIYVPLENGKEIILDSVWDGPFNTQKEFTHKEDHIMSEVHYLGSVGKVAMRAHTPGELIFTKPMDEYTEGEMDLLLARQRLEIEKANSARVGGPFNFQQPNYDAALAVVNKALANINNPDAIAGMGDAMIADATKKGKKRGAGKFFKKIGTGIKKGVKAISKVATAPLRLLAKGAMEIYIPKAAPMFLYLFADENVLPDKMKAKRKKADKFKKFVVKKLGMKDKHFMAIVRNKLTKSYGRSPESFLADAIKKIAIHGIGDPHGSKKRVNKQKGLRKKVSNVQTMSSGGTFSPGLTSRSPGSFSGDDGDEAGNSGPGENLKQGVTAAKKVASALARGDVIGGIMAAVSWLIQKLGGKKEGVSLSAEDMPDLAGDSGNAFNYSDLKQSYDNLSQMQRGDIKEVASDLIEEDADPVTAKRKLKQRLPYLSDDQTNEIADEVEEGYEELSPAEAAEAAKRIKAGSGGDNVNDMENSGGGTHAGACSC